MKVRDAMSVPVFTVTTDTPYKEMVERMVARDVSGMPVLDASGALVGIVTEADLVAKDAYAGRRHRALSVLPDLLARRQHHWASKAAGSTAADVMTKNVVVCRPGEDVRVVARRMLARGVKRMPVVEAGELVGIVSRHDVLKLFTRSDEAIAADVGSMLTCHPNRPDDAHVHSTVIDGIVTLSGDVRYSWEKDIVVEMVRRIEGVIDVVGELHNREPDPRPPSKRLVV